MRPSRWQYFFAEDWPARIWFGGVVLACVGGVVWYVGWPVHIGIVGYLLLIVGAAIAGLLSALVLGWPVLGPIYYDRTLKNGGPFKPGDRVRILAGKYRGRISHVYSTSQGVSLHVELGEKEKEKFSDIFMPWQLLREVDS